jgi:hypothetical protein
MPSGWRAPSLARKFRVVSGSLRTGDPPVQQLPTYDLFRAVDIRLLSGRL